MIRVFSIPSGKRLYEFRRGVARCATISRNGWIYEIYNLAWKLFPHSFVPSIFIIWLERVGQIWPFNNFWAFLVVGRFLKKFPRLQYVKKRFNILLAWEFFQKCSQRPKWFKTCQEVSVQTTVSDFEKSRHLMIKINLHLMKFKYRMSTI